MTDLNLVLWDSMSGRFLERWYGHPSKSIRRFKVSPDGNTIASGYGGYRNILDNDYSVYVSSLPGHTVQFALRDRHGAQITTVDFDASGHRLISGDEAGACEVWDLKAQKHLLGWQSSGQVIEVM